MSSLLLVSAARHWRRHPWQLLLALLGVALGVGVVLGIDLANASSLRAFDLSAAASAGRATHVITAPSGVDEQLFADLRREFGALAMAPVIERSVIARDADGRSQALRLIGIDPLNEARIRPQTGAVGGRPEKLMAASGAVALSTRTARRLGVGLGEPLRITVNGILRDAQWALALEPTSELERRMLDDVAVADMATAQELLGEYGRIDRIDLVVDESVYASSADAALAGLRAFLPADVDLEPSGRNSGVLARMTRGFRLNLQALGLLSLVVGAFLIFNTLRFGVVQRRELFGTLRSIGATRAQIRRLVLLEALLFGAAGSALGTLFGFALARGLVRLVARTIQDLYFAFEVQGVALDPWSLVKATVLGISVSAIAAWAPAAEAAAAPPRLARTRSEMERGSRRSARVGLLVATLCAVAGLALIQLSERSLPSAYLGLFLLVIGAALLAPTACGFLLPHAARPLGSLFGSFGALVARGASASLSRTGVAVAALAVALAASVGVLVMITSFRQTVTSWLEHSLTNDVYASPPSLVRTRNVATLPVDLVERLSMTPGLAEVQLYRGAEVSANGEPLELSGLGIDRRGFDGYRFKSGEPESAWAAFSGGSGVLISEPLAFRRNLEVGDSLDFATPKGNVGLPIAAIFYDFSSDRGHAVMALDVYRRLFDDPGVTSLAARAQVGVDPDSLVASMRSRLRDDEAVFVRSNRSLREETMAIFERTFAVTSVLRGLTVLVALFGIASALAAIAFDRAREVAVLRAVGMTRRQLVALIAGQCALLGATAGVLAIPLGALMAWVMIHVINRRSFGWTLLHFEIGPGAVVSTLLLATLAAVAAGLLPAWRMSRAVPARALRER